jgi:hypothetical protein
METVYATASQTDSERELAAALADQASAAALVKAATERLKIAQAARQLTKAAADAAVAEDSAAQAKENAAESLLYDVHVCYLQASRRLESARVQTQALGQEQQSSREQQLSAPSSKASGNTTKFLLPAAMRDSASTTPVRRSRTANGIVMRKRASHASGVGRPINRLNPFSGVTSGEKRPSLAALEVVRRLTADSNVVVNRN